jgi:hypothetical protein
VKRVSVVNINKGRSKLRRGLQKKAGSASGLFLSSECYELKAALAY